MGMGVNMKGVEVGEEGAEEWYRDLKEDDIKTGER